MHAFPEWFMVLMFFITNSLFWIAILVLVVILAVWIIRKIVTHFRNKKEAIITQVPTIDLTNNHE